MRVLLINKFHYTRDGATRAYFDTARILAENGHEVAFFSMEHPQNEPTPCAPFFVSKVDYLDAKQSFFSKARIGLRLIWNFEASRQLEWLIEEFQPEVAHLHVTYHQLSPSILWTLKKHGVAVVMTLHDYKAVSPNYNLFHHGKIWFSASAWRAVWDRVVKDSLIKSLLCAVETWLHRLIRSYRKVDRFIAPSRFLIETYKQLGFPYPIEQVTQPLDPFPVAPAQFGTGDYFLFVGRLSQEKGVHTLLDAFTDLKEEKLVIVGTGPEEARLKALQEAKGLRNVVFEGFQKGEALANLFRGAKALILPSVWYENMPYVMLEALGFGKPVIGSNLGGIPERIQDESNGLLFEAGNAESLRSALERFNQFDQVGMGKNAWTSIQDLTRDLYLAQLEAVYQSALDSLDKNQKI